MDDFAELVTGKKERPLTQERNDSTCLETVKPLYKHFSSSFVVFLLLCGCSAEKLPEFYSFSKLGSLSWGGVVWDETTNSIIVPFFSFPGTEIEQPLKKC